MTKYVIFDTETTGLTKTDEVIQFSAFVLDDSFSVKSAVNFYSDTQVPISAGAFNTHHLTKAKLNQLAGGEFFEDNWMKLVDELRQHQVIWVDWCNGSFDERMINQTLENNGLPDYFHFPVSPDLKVCRKNRFSVFNMMRALCQKLGVRSLNLASAVATLPFTKEQINNIYSSIAMQVPNLDDELRYHNALYDAFVTMILFKYYFT